MCERRVRILIRLIVSNLLIFSSVLFSQDSRPAVAILDFEGRGISEVESQTLTERFRSTIGNTGAVRLVERKLIEDVLQEQGFQQTGCTTNECAVAVGALLGVQYIMSGSIGKLGETFTIDVRMISVETASSIRSRNVTYTGKVDGLLVEAEILAYEMVEMEPPEEVLRKRKGEVQIATDIRDKIASAQADLPTVAVIDFEGRGISQLEAQTLTDRFRTAINNTGAVRLVERRMMEEVLDEQGFQQTGCISDECAVEVGQLLGVKYMVGGAIGKIGDTFTIDTRMIDIETGSSLRTRNITYVGKVDGLIIEVEILAYQMVEMEPPEALQKMRKTDVPAVASQGAIRGKTKMGAMMRSLVFPGLGQFYSDKRLWGFGWIAAELAVGGLIYTSFTTYQTAFDDYNKFNNLYTKETDVNRIAEYKSQARESHKSMDTANEQMKILAGVAGGIWLTNAIHAFIVGPKNGDTTDKGSSVRLAYDPETGQAMVRLTIHLGR